METHATEDWVTIERFRDLPAAIVARSALEAAGIPCFLRDEHTVRLDWQISNLLGGMRLQVLQGDQEAASEVLEGLSLEDALDNPELPAFATEVCPRCASPDIHREQRHRGLALAALYFLSLPVPRGPLEWHCEACGNTWVDPADG